MKKIYLIAMIFALLAPVNASHAQTARQAAKCIAYFGIAGIIFKDRFSYKEKIENLRMINKIERYLRIKAPKNHQKLIEASSAKVGREINNAKRSERATYLYFRNTRSKCAGYSYKP